MRLLLMFDLPVDTPDDKKAYRHFRKFLLNDTAAKAMEKRLRKNNPKRGSITLLKVTEKQYARMIYLHGSRDASIANSDDRIIFLGEDDYHES